LRAVLDPNVVVSALIGPAGVPADVLRAWRDGEFELIVSPALLAELGRVLGYPKLRERIDERDGAALIDWLTRSASVADDGPSALHSADPGDDYLLALAASANALLVSGDKHLLALGDRAPIYKPAEFLELVQLKAWGRSRRERA
jgi:putative PIN family toxin of toxin-antitoxin system